MQVGQLFVIEPEQVQHRGVEVVDAQTPLPGKLTTSRISMVRTYFTAAQAAARRIAPSVVRPWRSSASVALAQFRRRQVCAGGWVKKTAIWGVDATEIYPAP